MYIYTIYTQSHKYNNTQNLIFTRNNGTEMDYYTSIVKTGNKMKKVLFMSVNVNY